MSTTDQEKGNRYFRDDPQGNAECLSMQLNNNQMYYHFELAVYQFIAVLEKTTATKS